MLNTTELEQIVREYIANSVEENIVGLLDNAEWLNSVEDTIIEYAQQRVTAKFNNAETMKQILTTVEDSVRSLFAKGSVSSIKDLVSEKDIQRVVTKEIDRSVSTYVTNLFADKTWLENIESRVIANYVRTIEKELEYLNSSKHVFEYVEKLFKDYAKTIQFNGIEDKSEHIELTVLDGAVVTESDLVVGGKLSIQGSIDTETPVWESIFSSISDQVFENFEKNLKKDLLNEVLKTAKKSGIAFEQVLVEGSKLIENNTLNSTVKKLGTLDELSVRGEAEFNNTAYVLNKRLGINTTEPTMALGIWDEECEISIGKLSERTAFIGSTRKQGLQIGVNSKGSITIKDDGLVVINKLQLGKNRVSYNTEVPGYSGSKGDIVFNTNISKKNNVFAWMCIGGFNWVALRADVE